MAFPPSFIERLRSYYVLSDVIGKHIQIKKHGREYQALCPFHNEKTPSFTISNEKGFYHCFGCGAHGDVIGFLRQYEHMSYREAVEKLARDAGMELPKMTPEQQRRIVVERQMAGVLEETAHWFVTQLHKTENMEARHYLNKRGLSHVTQQVFGIGYAPDKRDALKQHLLEKGYNEQQAIEAGLLIKPDNGNSYDRFRGRLMFPIRSVGGKIVAFGGRLLENTVRSDGRQAPKYLNSPETELFHKGEMVYNLDLAGKEARGKNEIIIVEGYMDAIALSQAGFPHSVATLGTAVTAEHLRLLWQYAPEPILCLDGDAAGLRAMMRAAEIALPQLRPGHSLRFALLPEGEDPDSLVKHQGKEAMEKILKESRSLSETLWDHFSRDSGTTPEARAKLEETLNGLAGSIQNATVRSHMQSYFRKQMWESGRTATKSQNTRSNAVVRGAKSGRSDLRQRYIRQMLGIVLRQPCLLHVADNEESLARLGAEDPTLSSFCHLLLEANTEGRTDTAADLAAYLGEKGEEKRLLALLEETGSLVPKSVSESDIFAQKAWNHAIQAENQALLEEEYQELLQQLSEHMDEEGLSRLTDLQAALKQLKSQRNFATEDY